LLFFFLLNHFLLALPGALPPVLRGGRGQRSRAQDARRRPGGSPRAKALVADADAAIVGGRRRGGGSGSESRMLAASSSSSSSSSCCCCCCSSKEPRSRPRALLFGGGEVR
jgi:hypothetical protein